MKPNDINYYKLKTILLSMGIDAKRSDCGNFAEAFSKMFGGKVHCSYENYGFYSEGEPAHCMVKYKGKYIDIDGVHNSIQRLKDYAFNEMFPEDEKDIQIDKTGHPNAYKAIRNETTIKKIEKVLREFV